MVRILRILAGLAAAAALAGAILLIALRVVANDYRTDLRTEQATDFVRAIGESERAAAIELINLSRDSTTDELLRSRARAALDSALSNMLDPLIPQELAVYARDGLTVYSTAAEKIGARAALDTVSDALFDDDIVSTAVSRIAIGDGSNVRVDELMRTTVPIRGDAGTTVGLFALQSSPEKPPKWMPLIETGTTVVVFVLGLVAVLLYVLCSRVSTSTTSRTAADSGGDAHAAPRAIVPPDRATRTPELASRIRSDFAATISHEIRTPLNAVVGMTDLLKLTDLTRKQRTYLQTIQSGGDMLLSLVNNVLDFSRLETGNLAIRYQDFDVVDLVEKVLEIMGYSAYSKGIELIGTIRHELFLRVSGDKRRLRQILINLVGNSVKHTDSGEVSVDVRAFDRKDGNLLLQFRVSDTGSGMDEATRQALFTPFADRVPAHSGRAGSGIGFAICRKLVAAMGGEIEVSSGMGRGTRVVFTVPAKKRESLVSCSASIAESNKPLRVLVAHGNQAAARSVCHYLKSWQIECAQADGVDDMMHRLRSAASSCTPFHKVIIDADLTPGDSLPLARKIRDTAETSELPIVLLTSISSPLEEVGAVSRIGGIRCVNKPVLPLDLRYHLISASLDDVRRGTAVTRVAPRNKRLRILIVEDNVVNSSLMVQMLQSEGYSSDVVTDADAAILALKRVRYDLLLMDGQLPDMEGHKLAELIRRYPGEFENQPIIVAVTANASDRYRKQCLESGMDDFIAKPVRLDKLRVALAKWTRMAAGQRPETGKNDAAARALRQRLIEHTGQSNESFLIRYVDLFLADTDRRLTKLAEAIESADREAAQRECHGLKGACLELGAERMTTYCDALLAAARGNRLDEAASILERMGREFARLRPLYQSVASRFH